jgi:hypothetical protein
VKESESSGTAFPFLFERSISWIIVKEKWEEGDDDDWKS